MPEVPYESITAKLGVNILVRAEHLLDEGVPEKCLSLLNEHGVIVFPRIAVSDEARIAFSNRLGTMRSSLLSAASDNKADQMGIYPVTLDKSRVRNLDYIYSNEHWHIDGTKYAVPPKATNLKCEVAPSSGGDTGFANLLAAYRELPDEKNCHWKTCALCTARQQPFQNIIQTLPQKISSAGRKTVCPPNSRWCGNNRTVAGRW